MCTARPRDGPVKAAKRWWRWRRWWWRCAEVKAFLPGKKEQHVPQQSIPDITPGMCQIWSSPRQPPVTHSVITSAGSRPLRPPACTFFAGSDGGLMACSLGAAINLFIGHLPASWRRISRSRTIRALD